MDQPYTPRTIYVKYFEEGERFCYATAQPNTYFDLVPSYRLKIEGFLAKHPEFISADFAVDTQAMEPMFMEPEAGLVYFDEASSCLRILLGTQSPDGDIADILAMYGDVNSPIRVKEIELTSCFLGGGFGGRDSSPFSLLLALTAAFSNGKPVKLAHDRFEQFRLGLKRPGAKICGRLVIGADMKLQSITANLDFKGGGLKKSLALCRQSRLAVYRRSLRDSDCEYFCSIDPYAGYSRRIATRFRRAGGFLRD